MPKTSLGLGFLRFQVYPGNKKARFRKNYNLDKNFEYSRGETLFCKIV